jgi:hypothetical protein
MTNQTAIVTVVGAGGKMGQRISNNLARSDYRVRYCENSPHGRELITGLGRELTDTDEAVAQSDVVILAVPDVVLGKVSAGVVPVMKPGAILLTLDPAARTPTCCTGATTSLMRSPIPAIRPCSSSAPRRKSTPTRSAASPPRKRSSQRSRTAAPTRATSSRV